MTISFLKCKKGIMNLSLFVTFLSLSAPEHLRSYFRLEISFKAIGGHHPGRSIFTYASIVIYFKNQFEFICGMDNSENFLKSVIFS